MTDLESLGLTKQRRAVLQVIRGSEAHLTASEVFEGARRVLPGISFATVYNSLRYLREERLIGEVRHGGDATRYDRKLSRHDHAICNTCGKLIDLDLPLPDEMLKRAESLSKFKALSTEVILRGVCPECVERGRLRLVNKDQNT